MNRKGPPKSARWPTHDPGASERTARRLRPTGQWIRAVEERHRIQKFAGPAPAIAQVFDIRRQVNFDRHLRSRAVRRRRTACAWSAVYASPGGSLQIGIPRLTRARPQWCGVEHGDAEHDKSTLPRNALATLRTQGGAVVLGGGRESRDRRSQPERRLERGTVQASTRLLANMARLYGASPPRGVKAYLADRRA